MDLIKTNLKKIVVCLSVVSIVLVTRLLFNYLNKGVNNENIVPIISYISQILCAISLICLAYNDKLNTKLLILPLSILFGYMILVHLYAIIKSNNMSDLFYVLLFTSTLVINIIYINGNVKIKNCANILLLSVISFSFIEIFNSSLFSFSQFLTEISILALTYLLDNENLKLIEKSEGLKNE